MRFHRTQRRSGFSLVELTIVIVFLGALTVLALPRYRQALERTKASEAFQFLEMVESSQLRHMAENGAYASRLLDLDVEMGSPVHFAVAPLASDHWETQWECRLTRSSSSSGFGRYSVTFDQDGFNARRSTIPPDLSPTE